MTPTQSIAARCTAQAHLPSPLGPMLLARTEAGLAGAWFESQKWHPAELNAPERPDDGPTVTRRGQPPRPPTAAEEAALSVAGEYPPRR